MPSFKRVPDEPGWWVRFYLYDGEIGDPQSTERFVLSDIGIVYGRSLTVNPFEAKYSVWYGPIPSTLPEGWEDA